jgi:hypothetical protein
MARHGQPGRLTRPDVGGPGVRCSRYVRPHALRRWRPVRGHGVRAVNRWLPSGHDRRAALRCGRRYHLAAPVASPRIGGARCHRHNQRQARRLTDRSGSALVVDQRTDAMHGGLAIARRAHRWRFSAHRGLVARRLGDRGARCRACPSPPQHAAARGAAGRMGHGTAADPRAATVPPLPPRCPSTPWQRGSHHGDARRGEQASPGDRLAKAASGRRGGAGGRHA